MYNICDAQTSGGSLKSGECLIPDQVDSACNGMKTFPGRRGIHMPGMQDMPLDGRHPITRTSTTNCTPYSIHTSIKLKLELPLLETVKRPLLLLFAVLGIQFFHALLERHARSFSTNAHLPLLLNLLQTGAVRTLFLPQAHEFIFELLAFLFPSVSVLL